MHINSWMTNLDMYSYKFNEAEKWALKAVALDPDSAAGAAESPVPQVRVVDREGADAVQLG